MAVKEMILNPIYWGEWWVPAKGNAYNWAEVNGKMAAVLQGRYMDGLNQYGIGRGSIARTYVHQIDPPAGGFGDDNVAWLFKKALEEEQILAPDMFDAATQQPFYCLIVKPGIEHLLTANPARNVKQWDPDTKLGGYHSPFSYEPLDGRPRWEGPLQKCWVKATADIDGTVQRWVHEMAEAYTVGAGEVADDCEGKRGGHLVFVDGVSVPQYWSRDDNECWPPSDTMGSVEEADRERAGAPLAGPAVEVPVDRADTQRAGGRLAEPPDGG